MFDDNPPPKYLVQPFEQMLICIFTQTVMPQSLFKSRERNLFNKHVTGCSAVCQVPGIQ